MVLQQLLVLLGIVFLVLHPAVTLAAADDDLFSQLEPLIKKESNVLTFTSANSYRKFVTNPGRNYDTFVMLTASKNVGCTLCQDWEEAFVEVALTAKSQLDPSDKMLFAMVKYDSVPDVFRIYKLNHAPVILYIPHDLKETETMVSKLTMNLANLESAFPDPIAHFVTQRSGKKVEIIHSPWPKIIKLISFLVFVLVAGRRTALFTIPILRKQKWFWFIVSIVLYGLGSSGSVYSYLRNVPNHGIDQKTRRPVYFAGDRAQYFYEGIIIWGLLVFGGAALALSAYVKLPKTIGLARPFFQLIFLAMFSSMFKVYVTLYLGKAQWYRYGMQDIFARPWV